MDSFARYVSGGYILDYASTSRRWTPSSFEIMKIAVIGTGYVGLVTGACFAETGNDVICVDSDQEKIRRLTKGDIPFYDPGLSELVARNVEEKRLQFSTDTKSATMQAKISFVCVGTPSKSDGSADLNAV